MWLLNHSFCLNFQMLFQFDIEIITFLSVMAKPVWLKYVNLFFKNHITVLFHDKSKGACCWWITNKKWQFLSLVPDSTAYFCKYSGQ
jgi:hypothetical protein